jgi:sulfate permease, SulP family
VVLRQRRIPDRGGLALNHIHTPSALLPRFRAAWLPNVRIELLAGLVVAIALIPEAVSFALIAGVDPASGLWASVAIAITLAVCGGRPGMISAATGAMALVVAPLVATHGAQYLFAAAILAGLIQIGLGAAGVARLMRFVPRPVMVGFVNALAILIFAAQLPHFIHGPVAVYAIVLIGLATIWLLPRLTRAVPAPLVAIVLLSGAAFGLGLDVPLVKDIGDLPTALPGFGLPGIPFTFETLQIVAPYAFTLAVVGLIESLLTAQLIDTKTDTRSNKSTECRGQGLGNVLAGMIGGMPGCAMIGQSMINLAAGGRSRLSSLASGVFLLVLLLAFGGVVGSIPVAALVAVMIVVASSTFDWSSIRVATLRREPRSEIAVMLLTVAVVVATSNLALGVAAGVILSAIFFARRVAHLVEVTNGVGADGVHLYTVRGQLFFVSSGAFMHAFDSVESDMVVIDLSHAHVWDSSAVASLDTVVAKLEGDGRTVRIRGLNPHSAALHARLTGQVAASH